MADPDARRRAEEALAEYDRLWGAAHATNAYGRAVVGLASALRALLAAGPEAKTPPSDAVPEAVMAGAELLSAVRGAPTGSIGAIDNTYLPQIGREWLRPIEERIDAGVSALAASPATLATVTVPAGVAGPDDPIRVRLVPDDAAVREAAACTGVAAVWCPVHGNCNCPRTEHGERVDEKEYCPLHGRSSTHAEAEIAALSSSAAPPCDAVREAAEALRLRGCVEKILAFLLPIDVVRLVCRTTPETRQSAATAIGNARLACDYALNGGKPENILAPERLSSARSAKGGE